MSKSTNMPRTRAITWLVAGAALLACAAPMLAVEDAKKEAKAAEAAEKAAETVVTTTGSGERYTTTVRQETSGELKPEDVRQASMLGSRILTHVHNATKLLADEKPDRAKVELEHAQSLVAVVRDLLPVTVISTTVKSSDGKEVYVYQDRVQPDQIPLYEGMIGVEVVQPIVDAKKEQAALRGLRLADADLIHTSVTLDLDYLERKIRQGLAKVAEPEKALAELALAQAYGVQFSTHREDSPLVEAQAALRLAERQVREQKFEGAKANLQLARIQLEAHRALIGQQAGERVRDLEKDIGELESKLREPGAADRIAGFWDRVSGWFKREANEPQKAQTAGARERQQSKPRDDR